ncbi:MAG: hypothetical protein LBS34_02330 [Rickettsiales bacterium]|jgi:hypothetical protein|nr:hypothetical protein [Rickettsiales bacterium]
MKKCIVDFIGKKTNTILVGVALVVTILAKENHFGWLVSILVTHSIMSNNYRQTLGLFRIPGGNTSLAVIWMFFGVIFVTTMLISWIIFDGEIHYGLLNNIEYVNISSSFYFILVPILLKVLTKFNIPISATLLIIPLFSTSSTVRLIIKKTLVSYSLPFVVSFLTWSIICKCFKHLVKINGIDEQINKVWYAGMYVSTGVLWSVWNIINMCNFVIFVSRKFDLYNLFLFGAAGVLLLYTVLKDNEGKIQIKSENVSVANNVKSAVIFNILFTAALSYLQFFSKVPLITILVFLGLLDGKELSTICFRRTLFLKSSLKISLIKIAKGLSSVTMGIIISLAFVEIIGLFPV